VNLPLLRPEQHWVCPNCDQTAVTHIPPGTPASQFHICQRGLSLPMIPEGMDAKVQVLEREDWVNGELVQTDDDGRPVMSAVTTRADGSNDTAVYAPSARLDMEDRCLIRAARLRG
jgi:hypothetical protein